MNPIFYYLRFTLTLLLLTSGLLALAQDDAGKKKHKLGIDGTVYEGRAKLQGVNVSVKSDGKVYDEAMTNASGKFEFELDFDKNYIVYFEKDGYVTKMVQVDSRNVPEKELKYGFSYGRWKVDLFSDALGVNASILSKPVAKIVYNPGNVQFGLDKKYQKSMKPGLDRLNEAVRKAYESLEEDSEQEYIDYMLAVKDGDEFLREKDYENAIIQYEAAAEMRPDESYPPKQINKVNALRAASQGVEERYNTLLTQADDAFGVRDWPKAKSLYQQALDVKKQEAYPKAQIEEINRLIAEDRNKSEAEKLAALRAEYDALIVSADAKFNEKQYAEAKPLYQSAMKKMPDEEYPPAKLAEISKLLAASEAMDKEYNKHVAKGDKMLALKNYAGALSEYEAALALRKEDEYVQKKITDVNILIASMASLEAQKLKMAEAEAKRTQERYDEAIRKADISFEAKQYNLAISGYEEALEIFKDKPYPKEQIRLSNQKLAEFQGIEKQYDKNMLAGNKYFTDRKYDQAKNSFQQALNLKPDDKKAKEQIALVDIKLGELAAAAIASQKATDDKYNQHLTIADKALNENNFELAETEYVAALKVKPGEEYPKGQLALVKDKRIAALAQEKAEAKKQQEVAKKQEDYDAAIAKGDKLLEAKDYDAAKIAYLKASELLPIEEYPKTKIAEIDEALEAIVAATLADKKAYDNRYNGLIEQGDKAIAGGELIEAKSYFEQALDMKPKEQYPKAQLDVIKSKMDEIAKAEAMKAKQEADLAQKEAQYNEKVAKADQMFSSKNYAGAKVEYQQASIMFPDKSYPAQKIAEIDAIVAAAEKAEADKKALAKAEEEKEQQYKALIQQGDQNIEAKNWVAAIEMYNNAGKLYPDRSYPQTQLAKIEGLKAEEARLAESQKLEEEMRIQNQAEYTKLVQEGNKFMADKKYEKARFKYEAAAKLIPGDPVASQKMKEAAKLHDEEIKAQEYYAQTDTEFNKQLAKDYKQGKTVKTEKEGNKTVTIVVIVNGDRGDEYRKEVYSWGQTFYLKNGKKIDKITYEKETR